MKNINDWQNYTFDTLKDFVRMYDNRQESIDKITEAFCCANNAHKGVYRASGESYISHPVAVANFLAIMRVDIDTICAGLLHDVVEDTELTKEDIDLMFGSDVANIVEGVTKINKMDDIDLNSLNMSVDQKNPENLRILNRKKIIDSLLYDPRIIIVKLADRLHNMLTIGYKTKNKQKSKAVETLGLYVPLANKLGIYRIQQELEDASLKCIDPMLYERIKISREYMKKENIEMLDDMFSNMINVIKDNIKLVGHYDESEIQNRDTEELLHDTLLFGDNLSRIRIKHIYGIYDALLKLKPSDISEESYLKKLILSRENFEKIHDLRVIKLIMKDETSCWMARMLLHQTYSPVDKYGHDYIANPKSNMYKSLHDTVLCNGKFVQFQIRTEEQEYRNTYGLAWELYRYEGENTRERILDEFKKYPAYKKLLDIKEDKNVSDLENYQSLIDREVLNTKEITVINKATGKNVTLRDDATILDFAFQIAGEKGKHLVKATLNDVVYELKIKNGKVQTVQGYCPFDIRLRNGDEISVEFNENFLCPRPSADMTRKKPKKLFFSKEKMK